MTPVPANEMFEPKSVIYPSSSKADEILVAGEVDGEARNITVRDETLGGKFKAALAKRDEGMKAVQADFEKTHKTLSEQAFAKASTQFAKSLEKEDA